MFVATAEDSVDRPLADVEPMGQLQHRDPFVAAHGQQLLVPVGPPGTAEPARLVILALGKGALETGRRHFAPIVAVRKMLRQQVNGGYTSSSAHLVTYSAMQDSKS